MPAHLKDIKDHHILLILLIRTAERNIIQANGKQTS